MSNNTFNNNNKNLQSVSPSASPSNEATRRSSYDAEEIADYDPTTNRRQMKNSTSRNKNKSYFSNSNNNNDDDDSQSASSSDNENNNNNNNNKGNSTGAAAASTSSKNMFSSRSRRRSDENDNNHNNNTKQRSISPSTRTTATGGSHGTRGVTTTTSKSRSSALALSATVLVPNLAHRCILRDPTTRRVRFVPWGGNAAVIFADISGYSKLTSRLATEGLGATAVADAVNSYFARVIKIVSEHGGEIVKFAGDLCVGVWVAKDIEINAHRASFQALRCAGEIQRSCGTHVIYGNGGSGQNSNSNSSNAVNNNKNNKNQSENNNNNKEIRPSALGTQIFANTIATNASIGGNSSPMSHFLTRTARPNFSSTIASQHTSFNKTTTSSKSGGNNTTKKGSFIGDSINPTSAMQRTRSGTFRGTFANLNNMPSGAFNNNSTSQQDNSKNTNNTKKGGKDQQQQNNNNNNNSSQDAVTLHLHIGVACGELHAEVLTPPSSSEGVTDVLPKAFFYCSGQVLADAGDACTESPNGTICATPELLQSLGPTIRDMLQWEPSANSQMHLIRDVSQPVLLGKQSGDPKKLFNCARRDQDVDDDFIPPQLLNRLSHGLTFSDAMETRDVVVLFIKKLPESTSTALWFRDVSMLLARYRCPILQALDDDKGVHLCACLNLFCSEPNAGDLAVEMCRRICEDVCGVAIGIARGFALCGLVGDIDTCARPDIHGEVVVRACRLMEYAAQHFPYESLPFSDQQKSHQLQNNSSNNYSPSSGIFLSSSLMTSDPLAIQVAVDLSVVSQLQDKSQVKVVNKKVQLKGTTAPQPVYSFATPVFNRYQQLSAAGSSPSSRVDLMKMHQQHHQPRGGRSSSVSGALAASALAGTATLQQTRPRRSSSTFANYDYTFGTMQETLRNNHNNSSTMHNHMTNNVTVSNQYLSGISDFSADASKLLASICSFNRWSYTPNCRSVERQEFRDDYILGHHHHLAHQRSTKELDDIINHGYHTSSPQDHNSPPLFNSPPQNQNVINGSDAFGSGDYSFFRNGDNHIQQRDRLDSESSFLGGGGGVSGSASGFQNADFGPQSSTAWYQYNQNQNQQNYNNTNAHQGNETNSNTSGSAPSTANTYQFPFSSNQASNSTFFDGGNPQQHPHHQFSQQQQQQQQQPNFTSSSSGLPYTYILPPPMQLALISSCPLAGKKSLALSSCHWNGLTPIMHRATKTIQHNVIHTVAAWFCFHPNPTLREKARRCVSAFNKEGLSFVVSTLTFELIEEALEQNVRVAIIVDHSEFLDEVSLLFIRTAMLHITASEKKKDKTIVPTAIRRKSMVMEGSSVLPPITPTISKTTTSSKKTASTTEIDGGDQQKNQNEQSSKSEKTEQSRELPIANYPVPPVIARRRRESIARNHSSLQLQQHQQNDETTPLRSPSSNINSPQKSSSQPQSASTNNPRHHMSNNNKTFGIVTTSTNQQQSPAKTPPSYENNHRKNSSNDDTISGSSNSSRNNSMTNAVSSPLIPKNATNTTVMTPAPPQRILSDDNIQVGSFGNSLTSHPNISSPLTSGGAQQQQQRQTNTKSMTTPTTTISPPTTAAAKNNINNNPNEIPAGNEQNDLPFTEALLEDAGEKDTNTNTNDGENNQQPCSPSLQRTNSGTAAAGGLLAARTSSFNRLPRGASLRGAIRTRATAVTPNPISILKSQSQFVENNNSEENNTLTSHNNNTSQEEATRQERLLADGNRPQYLGIGGGAGGGNSNRPSRLSFNLVEEFIKNDDDGDGDDDEDSSARRRNSESLNNNNHALDDSLKYRSTSQMGSRTGNGRDTPAPKKNRSSSSKLQDRKQWMWILCHTPVYNSVGETHLQTLVVGSSQQSVKTIKLKELTVDEEIAVANSFIEVGENHVMKDSNWLIIRRLSNGLPGATVAILRFIVGMTQLALKHLYDYYPHVFEDYSEGKFDYTSSKYYLLPQNRRRNVARQQILLTEKKTDNTSNSQRRSQEEEETSPLLNNTKSWQNDEQQQQQHSPQLQQFDSMAIDEDHQEKNNNNNNNNDKSPGSLLLSHEPSLGSINSPASPPTHLIMKPDGQFTIRRRSLDVIRSPADHHHQHQNSSSRRSSNSGRSPVVLPVSTNGAVSTKNAGGSNNSGNQSLTSPPTVSPPSANHQQQQQQVVPIKSPLSEDVQLPSSTAARRNTTQPSAESTAVVSPSSDPNATPPQQQRKNKSSSLIGKKKESFVQVNDTDVDVQLFSPPRKEDLLHYGGSDPGSSPNTRRRKSAEAVMNFEASLKNSKLQNDDDDDDDDDEDTDDDLFDEEEDARIFGVDEVAPSLTKEETILNFGAAVRYDGHSSLTDHGYQMCRFMQWSAVSRDALSATDSMTDELSADLLIIVKVASLITKDPEDCCPVGLVAEMASRYLKVNQRSLLRKFEHLRALYFFDFEDDYARRKIEHIQRMEEKEREEAEKQRETEMTGGGAGEHAQEEQLLTVSISHAFAEAKEERQKRRNNNNNNFTNTTHRSSSHQAADALSLLSLKFKLNPLQEQVESRILPSMKREVSLFALKRLARKFLEERAVFEKAVIKDTLAKRQREQEEEERIKAQFAHQTSPSSSLPFSNRFAGASQSNINNFMMMSAKNTSLLGQQREGASAAAAHNTSSRATPHPSSVSLHDFLSWCFFRYLQFARLAYQMKNQKELCTKFLRRAWKIALDKDALRQEEKRKSQERRAMLSEALSGRSNATTSGATSTTLSGATPQQQQHQKDGATATNNSLSPFSATVNSGNHHHQNRQQTSNSLSKASSSTSGGGASGSLSRKQQTAIFGSGYKTSVFARDKNSLNPSKRIGGNINFESNLSELEWDSDTIARFAEKYEIPLSSLRDVDDSSSSSSDDDDENENEQSHVKEVSDQEQEEGVSLADAAKTSKKNKGGITASHANIVKASKKQRRTSKLSDLGNDDYENRERRRRRSNNSFDNDEENDDDDSNLKISLSTLIPSSSVGLSKNTSSSNMRRDSTRNSTSHTSGTDFYSDHGTEDQLLKQSPSLADMKRKEQDHLHQAGNENENELEQDQEQQEPVVYRPRREATLKAPQFMPIRPCKNIDINTPEKFLAAAPVPVELGPFSGIISILSRDVGAKQYNQTNIQRMLDVNLGEIMSTIRARSAIEQKRRIETDLLISQSSEVIAAEAAKNCAFSSFGPNFTGSLAFEFDTSVFSKMVERFEEFVPLEFDDDEENEDHDDEHERTSSSSGEDEDDDDDEELREYRRSLQLANEGVFGGDGNSSPSSSRENSSSSQQFISVTSAQNDDQQQQEQQQQKAIESLRQKQEELQAKELEKAENRFRHRSLLEQERKAFARFFQLAFDTSAILETVSEQNDPEIFKLMNEAQDKIEAHEDEQMKEQLQQQQQMTEEAGENGAPHKTSRRSSREEKDNNNNSNNKESSSSSTTTKTKVQQQQLLVDLKMQEDEYRTSLISKLIVDIARICSNEFRRVNSELNTVRQTRIEKLMKTTHDPPPDLRSPRVKNHDKYARQYDLLYRVFELIKYCCLSDDARSRIEMTLYANGATEGLMDENDAVRAAFVVMGVEDFVSPYPYQNTAQLRDLWFSGELRTVELKAFCWCTLLFIDCVWEASFESAAVASAISTSAAADAAMNVG